MAREKLVQQAKEQGKFSVKKILAVVQFEKTKAFKSYGSRFSKQIEKAKRITAKSVVASNEKLKKSRNELLQLANLEQKLVAALEPVQEKKPAQNQENELNGAEAANPKSKKTAPEESLTSVENQTIEQWLANRGFGKLSQDEQAVIDGINQLRKQAGLGKLEIDYRLCFAARESLPGHVPKTIFFSPVSRTRQKDICASSIPARDRGIRRKTLQCATKASLRLACGSTASPTRKTC